MGLDVWRRCSLAAEATYSRKLFITLK